MTSAARDEYEDDISKSNTDDMFAFSQIIAGGEKVSEVTKEIESGAETNKQDLDEDQAVLAFSNTLPGNADEPKLIEIDEKTRIQEAKASKELDLLNANDATSAFGVLAQA